MSFSTLLLDTDARGVATLALNLPDKHNALNGTMIGELRTAAAALATDTAIRVVVLTGVGVSFCAGGDLDWMREQMAGPRPPFILVEVHAPNRPEDIVAAVTPYGYRCDILDAALTGEAHRVPVHVFANPLTRT